MQVVGPDLALTGGLVAQLLGLVGAGLCCNILCTFMSVFFWVPTQRFNDY